MATLFQNQQAFGGRQERLFVRGNAPSPEAALVPLGTQPSMSLYNLQFPPASGATFSNTALSSTGGRASLMQRPSTAKQPTRQGDATVRRESQVAAPQDGQSISPAVIGSSNLRGDLTRLSTNALVAGLRYGDVTALQGGPSDLDFADSPLGWGAPQPPGVPGAPHPDPAGEGLGLVPGAAKFIFGDECHAVDIEFKTKGSATTGQGFPAGYGGGSGLGRKAFDMGAAAKGAPGQLVQFSMRYEAIFRWAGNGRLCQMGQRWTSFSASLNGEQLRHDATPGKDDTLSKAGYPNLVSGPGFTSMIDAPTETVRLSDVHAGDVYIFTWDLTAWLRGSDGSYIERDFMVWILVTGRSANDVGWNCGLVEFQ